MVKNRPSGHALWCGGWDSNVRTPRQFPCGAGRVSSIIEGIANFGITEYALMTLLGKLARACLSTKT